MEFSQTRKVYANPGVTKRSFERVFAIIQILVSFLCENRIFPFFNPQSSIFNLQSPISILQSSISNLQSFRLSLPFTAKRRQKYGKNTATNSATKPLLNRFFPLIFNFLLKYLCVSKKCSTFAAKFGLNFVS